MQDTIRAANAEFYRAFEALSIEAMDAIWSHADDVRCVHPGWEPLSGWDEVRKSWAAIFDSATQAGAYMELDITDAHLWMSGDLTGIFCHENILSFRNGEQIRTLVLATNIFRREQGRWLMVQHHGSPVLTRSNEA